MTIVRGSHSDRSTAMIEGSREFCSVLETINTTGLEGEQRSGHIDRARVLTYKHVNGGLRKLAEYRQGSSRDKVAEEKKRVAEERKP